MSTVNIQLNLLADVKILQSNPSLSTDIASIQKDVSHIKNELNKGASKSEIGAQAFAALGQSLKANINNFKSGDPLQISIGVIDTLASVASVVCLALGPTSVIVGPIISGISSIVTGIMSLFVKSPSLQQQISDMLANQTKQIAVLLEQQTKVILKFVKEQDIRNILFEGEGISEVIMDHLKFFKYAINPQNKKMSVDCWNRLVFGLDDRTKYLAKLRQQIQYEITSMMSAIPNDKKTLSDMVTLERIDYTISLRQQQYEAQEEKYKLEKRANDAIGSQNEYNAIIKQSETETGKKTFEKQISKLRFNLEQQMKSIVNIKVFRDNIASIKDTKDIVMKLLDLYYCITMHDIQIRTMMSFVCPHKTDQFIYTMNVYDIYQKNYMFMKNYIFDRKYNYRKFAPCLILFEHAIDKNKNKILKHMQYDFVRFLLNTYFKLLKDKKKKKMQKQDIFSWRNFIEKFDFKQQQDIFSWRNNDGMSSFMYAVENDNINSVEWMMKSSIDPMNCLVMQINQLSETMIDVAKKKKFNKMVKVLSSANNYKTSKKKISNYESSARISVDLADEKIDALLDEIDYHYNEQIYKNNKFRIKTKYGFLCLDNKKGAGYIYATDDQANALLFTEKIDKNNIYLESWDDKYGYKGYYLTSNYTNGIYLTGKWDDASYWTFTSNGCLISKNFKSAGQKMSFNTATDPFYCYDKYKVCDNITKEYIDGKGNIISVVKGKQNECDMKTNTKMKISTQSGYFLVKKSDGYVYATNESKNATIFEIKANDSSYYIVVSDSKNYWDKYYLTSDYKKGMYVTSKWDDTAYWELDGTALICKNFNSAGQRVSYYNQQYPFYCYDSVNDAKYTDSIVAFKWQ